MSAFLEGEEVRETVFLNMVPMGKLDALRNRSLEFLDRALSMALARDAMPILSAEAVWFYFSEEAMQQLRHFLEAKGFQPHVVGYLRAPWDWLESGFQQLARVGETNLWEELMNRVSGSQPRGCIDRFDRVFGREKVALHFFDPEKFPGGCVVRHFCELNGISIPRGKVVRENESLNLNALRFVHAYNRHIHGRGPASGRFLRRAFLIEALAGLPGPPVRLHQNVTAGFVDPFLEGKKWLQERLGCEVSETLVSRRSGDVLRSREDLAQHGREAVDWLGRQLGRAIAVNSNMAGNPEVAAGLERLIWRSPGAMARVLWDKFHIRAERARRRREVLNLAHG